MKTNKAYAVKYRLFSADEEHTAYVSASNKEEAYERAVYEEIPKTTGEPPYSAWVYSVTYQNGNYHRFNTFEGKRW